MNVEDKESPKEKAMALLSRIAVWSVLAAIIYLLRNFFLLVFLTFVFCWIQFYGEKLLTSRIQNRSLRVTIVGIGFLAILIAIGAFTIPRAQTQAQLFLDRYPTYLRHTDAQILELRTKYPLLETVLPEPSAFEVAPEDTNHWSPKNSPTALVVQELIGGGTSEGTTHGNNALTVLQNVGVKLFGTLSSFLLALLFSFLILLDLERLRFSIAGLRNTKLQFVYDEVAEGMYDFGQVLGRALGAQVVIALLNTIMTAGLILFLGLGDKLAFLSLVVFLCSFIPVAGVFISSIPICLILFQESGLQLMVFAALSIWVIHLMEAYVFNPRIFGKHLRINPVLVLIILTVSGKLFGVWGLILGVPICSYIFGHAIRYRSASQKAQE